MTHSNFGDYLSDSSVEYSSVNWEKDIYAKGLQTNMWPFSEVVSTLTKEKRKFPQNREILEIGSGAGNNLWFLSMLGYQAAGIDYSETAVEFAKQRLSALGLPVNVKQGNVFALPWEAHSFDYVLDRGTLTCVGPNIASAVEEISRVLRPGGRVFSFGLFASWLLPLVT